MQLARILLSLCAVVAVSAVYTPSSRQLHARHAAALRNARAPVAAPEPLVKAKRQSKKCRPRPSSSSAPAPPPSSSAAPPPVANPGAQPTTHSEAPKPSPTPAPSPTTQKPDPPKTTSKSSGGGCGNNNNGGGGGSDPFPGFFAGVNHGADVTFYALGLTACGTTFSDNDMVCAIPEAMFDSVPGANGNPNNNPVCGKRINLTYGGKTVNVAIQDRCTGCTGASIDLSPAAFNQLSDPGAGRLHGASWTWA